MDWESGWGGDPVEGVSVEEETGTNEVRMGSSGGKGEESTGGGDSFFEEAGATEFGAVASFSFTGGGCTLSSTLFDLDLSLTSSITFK